MIMDKDLVSDAEYLKELSLKIYDEYGNEIKNPDLEKGYLKDGSCEKNKYGAWRMTQIYHSYTDDEIEKMRLEKEAKELAESRKPLSLNEVTILVLKAQINTVDIPDQTSLRMIDYYPTFEESVGLTVQKGYKFRYKGLLYKTIQDNLFIQQHLNPSRGTESLYIRIDLEHTGAIYDPIPYDGNMELFEGEYYIQDDVIYICIRNSEQALHDPLKKLVNIYVEIADEDDDKSDNNLEFPDFKKPTGAHDAYMKGDKVTFEGKHYISKADNNVYSPSEYPANWELVD